MIEKLARRRKQFRAPRHITLPDYPHPLALLQRADDVRVDRHAADLLDIATRDRLAISNERQRLEQGAGVPRGLLIP